MNYDPSEDGITHLNVYSKALTPIGRLLSNFYPAAVKLEKHGFFASVEGYWYWLSTGCIHDELRYLWGFEAKRFGKDLPKVKADDFREDILHAIECKIEQNLVIKQLLIESAELPLTHYYVYGEVDNPYKPPTIIPLPQYDWMIEHIDKIRTRLKEHVKIGHQLQQQIEVYKPAYIHKPIP